jgi:hypothetical protein
MAMRIPSVRKLFDKLLRKHDSARDVESAHRGGGADFRAISIVATSTSCRQSKVIRGKRFLVADVPRIPLPSCPHPAICECRYRKFADRRLEDRRDIATGQWYSGLERRRSLGRRSTDSATARIELQ